jgi:chromosome segregation ATPase
MSRRKGATWILSIFVLSILAACRPVEAQETTSAGVPFLADLEAASNALGSAARGKADSRAGGAAILQAHKELIDFELKQQKELAAREKELREARGQIVSLKADLEKLQAAAKQRDAELAERAKERESLEAKSRELDSMRSQLDKLEASIATERQEREKTSAEAKRLQGEKLKLETELGRKASLGEPAAAQRTSESAEQLSSLRSQVQKLEASLAEERKELEKAQTDVKRLQAERESLQGQLAQLSKAPEQAASSQPNVTEGDVPRIKKWQKPDGSLFFGERPPAGSKLVGEVENMGTSGGGSN